MSTDFVTRISNSFQRMPNTREGMGDFAESAVEALYALDLEISELLGHRAWILDLLVRVSDLHEHTYSMELVEKDHDLASLMASPIALQPEIKQLLDHITESATRLSSAGETFADEALLDLIDQYIAAKGPLPWSNPHAAIAAILTREGQFRKVGPNRYTAA